MTAAGSGTLVTKAVDPTAPPVAADATNAVTESVVIEGSNRGTKETHTDRDLTRGVSAEPTSAFM